MNIRPRSSGVEVRTPAKLNLFFEVLSRRHDGFHEIETLMCPVGIYDTLFFEPHESHHLRLTSRWAHRHGLGSRCALGSLPSEEENIVTKAVELLRRRAGIEAGANIHLVKRIASEAGLGGGSSDAAAALVAANRAWRLGWDKNQLGKLAAELGSDVPFFLGRGAAVCRGRGEIIERVGGLGRWHIVVVRPPQGLSTAEVYKRCRPAATPRSAATLVEAMRSGSSRRLAAGLHNALEPAAEELSPWIARLRSEFAKSDVLGHQMSGSGTSYFGICRNGCHARRVAARLRSVGVGQVYITSNIA
jgi:4-diphosphocytidyl-2-C-methyl-D-erythritol kinase